MAQEIALVLLASIPPTFAAFAAWRSVGGRNGNGSVQERLTRLEKKIDRHVEWHLGGKND